ncbi:hypothetical protein HQ496_10040 [bacterium]|nr:hypothetical protein [bacterium]
MDWDISGSTVGISKVWDRNHVRARRSLAATCIVVSLFLLVLSGCDSESMFSSSSSSAERALQIMDPASVVLAHVDIEKGLESIDSFVFQSEEAKQKLDSAMNEISALMGFNPREDVHHLFLSVSSLDKSARMGMVAFVDFDQPTMTSRLNEAEELSKTSSAGKTDIYQLLDAEAVQFALVDGNMILVSNEANSLDGMITRSQRTDGGFNLDDALLNAVKSREHWLVVRNVDGMLSEVGNLTPGDQFAQLLPAIRAVQSIAVGLNTSGSDIEGALFIEPNAQVSAKDLASVLGGFRAAARIQLEGQDEILDQLENLDIDTSNGLVRIRMENDKDELLDLFKNLGSQLKEMAQSYTNQEVSK